MSIHTVSFETLKKKACKAFSDQITSVALRPGDGAHAPAHNAAAFQCLLAMARPTWLGAELSALRAFAKSLTEQASPTDALATRAGHLARLAEEIGGPNVAATRGEQGLTLIAAKAREEGFRIINRTDARCVGNLVDIFPEIVPLHFRQAAITLDADGPDGEWVATFDSSVKRQPFEQEADEQSAEASRLSHRG